MIKLKRSSNNLGANTGTGCRTVMPVPTTVAEVLLEVSAV